MDNSKTRAARIAAGLCRDCGGERDGEGATKTRCTPCAEKQRVYRRAAWHGGAGKRENETAKRRREARRDAGLCPGCGKELSPKEREAGVVNCARCRAAQRKNDEAYARRQRAHHGLWQRPGGEPLPVGRGAAPVKAVRSLWIGGDPMTLWAIQELKKRDRERRQKENGGHPVEVVYQLSRVLREAILFWEDRYSAPVRHTKHRTIIDFHFGFKVDARTLAVIERHALQRDGNLSATVCDLLIARSNSPKWTAAIGWKHQCRTEKSNWPWGD
jgi:hypothetical protein